jgi:hypothetical protein
MTDYQNKKKSFNEFYDSCLKQKSDDDEQIKIDINRTF